MAKTLYYGNPIDRANPLMRGLVSRWKVVPWYSSGGRFIDLAGKNHGTLANNAAWSSAAGRPGGSGSILFDGTGDYVDCGSSLPTLAGQYSFCGWMNARTVGEGTSGKMFATTKIILGIYTSSGNRLRATGDDSSYVNSTGTFAFNTWVHFGFTRAPATGIVKFYLNGIYAGSGNASLSPSTGTGYIGNRIGVTDRSFDGWLDDLTLFTRELSDSEVLALYNATRQQYDPTLNWYSHPIMMGAGAAPGGFNAYWARPHTRIIGGGVS